MSELEEVRVFVCLVESQSASKAAEKMGLANSAISRRMKALEAVSYTHLTLPTIYSV